MRPKPACDQGRSKRNPSLSPSGNLLQRRDKAMNRETIESALDANKLRVKVNSGNLWSCRRNGKTQTWKTRPNEFRIPIKYGFRFYGEITHENMNSDELVII